MDGAAPVDVGGAEDYGCSEEEDAIAAMMMLNGSTDMNEAEVWYYRCTYYIQRQVVDVSELSIYSIAASTIMLMLSFVHQKY